MLEDMVQMGPMLVLAGLVMGMAAETISRAGGFGLIPDMGVSLAGSVLVGGIVWVGISHEPGMLLMFLIGSVGGGLAVVAQRGLWRSTRLGT